MKYKSHATWSNFKETTDTHKTKEETESVCRILLSDYGRLGEYSPCSTRGVYLDAWVTEE